MRSLEQKLSFIRVTVLLSLMLVINACVSQPSDQVHITYSPTPGTSPTDSPVIILPTSSPTNSPTAIPNVKTPLLPRPTTIPTVDTVDDLWEWTIVAGPSEEIQAGFDYDGEILIWRKWTTPAGRSQTQVVQSGGTVTDLHQGPPGWEVTGQVLDGGRVVIVEYEESQGDYNLWVYELESGARTLLEQWGGEPKRHQIPMISLDGDRLAWLTTLDDGQSCIFIRNLATGTQFEAVCRPVDSNSVVIAPYLRWPVLTYQLIELAVDSDSDCRNIYTLRLPDGRPQPHVVTECEGFSGAADETVLVWTEMRSETAFPWKVPLYGVGRDGQVVKLGVAGAGSVAICEGRAYWKKECSNCPDEIRSWVPGEPVKVLYRSPDVQGESYATGISYATTLPRCHGSWVSLERTGGRHDTLGSPDTILIAQRPKDD